MITPDPSGWTVAITHPDTGRVRTPEVADLQNAPVFNPGPNAQPTVRVPVRKNDVWLSDTYDDDAEMRVWRDGRRLPIEVLRDVEQLEGATVLVGVGGVELEQRVREEYNDDRRHLAVRDLVETETTYADETPEPDVNVLADQVQQNPDTDAEFELIANFANPELLPIGSGVVSTSQTNVVYEGENATDDEVLVPEDDGEYSGGQAQRHTIADHFSEYDFTVDYDIPAGEFEPWVRFVTPQGQEVGTSRWSLLDSNGNTIVQSDAGSIGNPSLSWESIKDTWNLPDPGELPAGDYTLRFDIVDDTNLQAYDIDVVSIADALTRVTGGSDATDAYFFDNDNGGNGGYLDGPGLHPTVNARFEASATAFSITAGDATVTMNDSSNDQRVQMSNDGGATWLPNDGTETNTTSVTVDPFPDTGSTIALRVTLGGYEPNGPRNQTPRLNYTSQELDAYELRADISQELLLIEETFDTDLASVLTAIGEPAERSWGLRTDANGDIVVRFVQNGQFDAEYTPEFSDRTREKLGKTYDSVTVKGSNEPESNIPYTASTTFEALPRENILAGSETVYDDTRNYERGDDYEINYQTGEIRATSGGDLVVGDAYRIDFRYQARGTFESPDAPTDPDELVTTVPGVTSQRLAEQVAFVLASEVDTPRYAAEVTIPDPDPRFDPTDALPPAALGLPSGIDSLEVRGGPQLTETGLAVRFGTRPPVEATQERLSTQLGRVSDRS